MQNLVWSWRQWFSKTLRSFLGDYLVFEMKDGNGRLNRFVKMIPHRHFKICNPSIIGHFIEGYQKHHRGYQKHYRLTDRKTNWALPALQAGLGSIGTLVSVMYAVCLTHMPQKKNLALNVDLGLVSMLIKPKSRIDWPKNLQCDCTHYVSF